MLKRIKRKKEEEEEQASGSEEETLEQPQKKPKEEQQEPEIKKDPWYVNKQRTLVFSTRGVTNRARHFLKDLRDLLPHSKKDAKLDSKGKKLSAVNEVCEMKDCNNCIFFGGPKKKRFIYVGVSNTGWSFCKISCPKSSHCGRSQINRKLFKRLPSFISV